MQASDEVLKKKDSSKDSVKAVTDLDSDLHDCEEAMKDTNCDAFADFMGDLSAFRIVLHMHILSKGPKPTVVRDALERMRVPEMHAFQQNVAKVELWLHVLASANSSMQMSAQSTLAISKLAHSA